MLYYHFGGGGRTPPIKIAYFHSIKQADGKWKYVRAKYRNNRLVENGHDFILRYQTAAGKRVWERVGPDALKAQQRYFELQMLAVQNALPEPSPRPKPTPAPAAPKRLTIEQAAFDYLEKVKIEAHRNEKGAGTVVMYGNAIRDFKNLADGVGKKYMDEIDGTILLAYKEWCYTHLRKRAYGEQTTTISNRFRYLNTWLHRYSIQMLRAKNAPIGAPGLLSFADIPHRKKKNADKFADEHVERMLAVADEDETDLILFFLFTGFRDEEVAHCEWQDINWERGTINVNHKPHWRSIRHPNGWRVKDRERRPVDIPLPKEFVERMKARRERSYDDVELIFPAPEARKPDNNLIKRLRKVWEGAELEGRFTLHKFRRTAGTIIANKLSLETARQWLGHSDIKTTAGYIAAEALDTPEAKQKVAEGFGKFLNRSKKTAPTSSD